MLRVGLVGVLGHLLLLALVHVHGVGLVSLLLVALAVLFLLLVALVAVAVEVELVGQLVLLVLGARRYGVLLSGGLVLLGLLVLLVALAALLLVCLGVLLALLLRLLLGRALLAFVKITIKVSSNILFSFSYSWFPFLQERPTFGFEYLPRQPLLSQWPPQRFVLSFPSLLGAGNFVLVTLLLVYLTILHSAS